jgi:peptidoglycan/LPS O-acetylase OafA/YrhL
MISGRLLGNLTLTEAWRCHLTHQLPTVLFWVPAWTLAYEEQFYFVTGLTLLFARRFLFVAASLISLVVIAGSVFISGYDGKTNGTFLNCLWLAFAAGVLAYYAINYVKPERRDWFCIPLIVAAVCVVANPGQQGYLDGKWVMALCGIAAYYIWKYSAPRWRALFVIPLALGICYAVAGHYYALRRITPETSEQCVAAFFFAFLIIVLKKWDNSMCRSKALAPLRFCGEMCYSLYLLHWPIVAMIGHAFVSRGITNPAGVLFITVPCCIVATLPVAWVFHRLVERRFWNQRI